MITGEKSLADARRAVKRAETRAGGDHAAAPVAKKPAL
jgi:hypothetical protein